MDEVMETTGLRLQQLKEAARDRVGYGKMWAESSKGDVCVMIEQGDKVIYREMSTYYHYCYSFCTNIFIMCVLFKMVEHYPHTL